MENPSDETFKSICDIDEHLFITPDKDVTPEKPKDDLFKWCFVCDRHITFWCYRRDNT